MEPITLKNKRPYDKNLFGIRRSLIIIHFLEAAILGFLLIGLVSV